jgi:hypothetical protein
MRAHSSKYLFSTVYVVCLACRYVHIQLYIQNTSYFQYFFGSTTNQALGDQGINKWWPKGTQYHIYTKDLLLIIIDVFPCQQLKL